MLLVCRWEKVQAKHSWNANWIATSAITFRLQRHADHHLASSRPYQVIRATTTPRRVLQI